MVIISSLTLATAVFGIAAIDRLAHTTDEALAEHIPLSRCAEQAALAVSQATVTLNQGRMVRDPEKLNELRALEGKLAQSMIRFDMFVKAMIWGSESEAFRKSCGGLTFAMWEREGWSGTLVVRKAPPSVRQVAGKAELDFGGFSKHARQVLKDQGRILRLELSGDSDAARDQQLELEENLRRADQLAGQVNDALESTIVNVHRHLETTARKVERTQRQAKNALLLFSGIAFAASLVLGTLFSSRTIVRPLKRLREGMEIIGTGNLEHKVGTTKNDEIGQLSRAFDQMAGSLRDLLAETKTMTAEVATSSHEIATSAQEQVASLTESATSISQITAGAEQFKATMQEFADRARAVQDVAEETGKRSEEGLVLTRDSADRIDHVRDNSHVAGESVVELVGQMQRINEISTTVNEIAEQTKLLSLNASIEAARAGEEGRGFAVVATQVRELANQSKEAVRRIESTIAETQKTMQAVVAQIEEGARLSEESSEMVKRVVKSFEEIAKAVSRTTEAMTQIAAGAKDQEEGTADLASGIVQVDTASNEALKAAQQTQKAITEIDGQIGTLNDRMARFQT
jgi:methyl-accepting chemotaxis protein